MSLSQYLEKFQKDDEGYRDRRRELPQKIGIPNLWEIVDHFGLYAGVQTIGNRLATFEIFKKCLNVPGHIAEFGCWKGANLLFMAKLLQLLQPNSYKHIYGFDSFEGLQTFSAEDGESISLKGKYQGNEQTLTAMIEFFEMEDWIHLVKGNALDTIPQFEKDNPHILFSMVYIDFDLYEPCKVALEYAGRRVVPGGIIVLDEALTNLWPGEGQALAEFLNARGAGEYTVGNIAFARQPTVYLVKK